jgi:hypothetical protein
MSGMLIEICKGNKSLEFYASNFTSYLIRLLQENLGIIFIFYSGKIVSIELIFTSVILDSFEEFSVCL